MKKMLKIVLLVVLSVSSLNAKVLFDLQDQYFEYSYKQNKKVSLYDLKNIQLRMNNIFQDKTGE